MEKQLLRLLFVDESPDDVEAITSLLRKADYRLKSQRVQDPAALQSALAKGEWDAVIADQRLATASLQQVKQAEVDVPVIAVAHKPSEADVAKLMRAGAQDFIDKDQPARLVPALERELNALRCRIAGRDTEKTLKELEDKHRVLVDAAREAVCYTQDGMHIDANRAYLQLFGFENPAEIEGIPFLNLVAAANHAAVKAFMRKGGNAPVEFAAIRKDGSQFTAEASLAQVTLKGEPCQQLVVNDVSRFRSAEKKVQYLSQHDPLTGLLNRHAFFQELGKAVEKAKTGAPRVLLAIDVDGLGAINETLGHEAGDGVLLKLARLLKDKVGASDTCARVGADEFAVLFAEADAKKGNAAAEVLAQTFKGLSVDAGGKPREVKCAVVIAPVDKDAESAHKFFSGIQAKLRPARPAAPAPAPAAAPIAVTASDSEWRDRVARAIAEKRLRLIYQPVVNLAADPLEQYEVLLRLDENGKETSPAEMFAAAERNGQGVALDLYVVEQAIDALLKARAANRKGTFFLNVSTSSLLDKTFSERVQKLLTERGLGGDALGFEMEEAAAVQYAAESAVFVRSLARAGCQFALDNFGGRIAGFAQLRALPITFLKIDGALIMGIAEDEIKQIAVQALTEIARALEKKTVAKSVESAETLTVLFNKQIDYVQGNYLQPPMPEPTYDFNIESLSSEEVVTGWRPNR